VALLTVVWMIPRLLPGHSAVAPAVPAALDALRVVASSGSGRFEVRGFPAEGGDVTGLFHRAEAVTGRARLEAVVATGNEDLARVAEHIGTTVEVFPEEGVTGIRLSGAIIPFYDRDADRLAQARREGAERPRAALEAVAEILDARLSEPQEGFVLEDSVRRRDLTRLLREVQEALRGTQAANDSALAELRSDLLDAALRSEGPFRRRGPLRVMEIVLASLLGAALRESLRRRSADPPGWLAIPFAAPLATTCILLLEGTPALPVDPLAGTAARFIPFAFGVGFLTPGLLAGLARLEIRLRRPEPPAPPPPAPRERAAAAASTPAHRPPEAETPRSEREIPEDEGIRPAPPAPLPTPQRLPFLPRRPPPES